MTDTKLKKIVIGALFAALTCIATMVIQVPSPANGYVNLGDGVVLLSAWILGPVYGPLSAGTGSMFADIFSGYAHYAPGTFIIKALTALTAYCLRRTLTKINAKSAVAEIVAGVAGEAVMVIGYFFYAMLFLQRGLAAAASIPGNVVQGVFGIAIAVLVYEILKKSINLDAIAAKK